MAEIKVTPLPDGIELRSLTLPRGEVGNERQVGDLNARPPELEDDHEDEVITELWPIVQVLAAQTHVEDEGERDEAQHRPCVTSEKLR